MLERTIVVDQPAAFEDYRAAYRKHVFSRTNALRLLVYPLALIVSAIAFTIAFPNPAVLPLYYGLLALSMVLTFLSAWFLGPRRAWKAHQEWGALRYVFSDDGVSTTTGSGALTMYPGSNVRRFVDAEGVILL